MPGNLETLVEPGISSLGGSRGESPGTGQPGRQCHHLCRGPQDAPSPTLRSWAERQRGSCIFTLSKCQQFSPLLPGPAGKSMTREGKETIFSTVKAFKWANAWSLTEQVGKGVGSVLSTEGLRGLVRALAGGQRPAVYPAALCGAVRTARH